jgi:hypothetical protein
MAWLQRVDSGARLGFAPYQDELFLRGLSPDADPARASREMLVVTPSGKVHGGFFALRQVSLRLWKLWP